MSKRFLMNTKRTRATCRSGSVVVGGLLVAMMYLTPGFAQAEDPLDLSAVREEFARAYKKVSGAVSEDPSAKAADSDGYVQVDKDLEGRNQDLEEAEAALLRKLKDNATTSTSAAAGSNTATGFKSKVISAPPSEESILEKSSVPVYSANAGVEGSEKISESNIALTNSADEVLRESFNATGSGNQKTARPAVELQKAEGAINTLQTQSTQLQRTIESMRLENESLKRQAGSAQKREQDLRRELGEVRNRLMIAETEVRHLSDVIDARNRNTLTRLGQGGGIAQASTVQTSSRMKVQPQGQTEADAASARIAARTQADTAANKAAADDMLIGTVVADKVNLRAGPGKDNSPLMTVARGTRLTVETRSGDWYRVISPTGARAWVASEVLAFGGTNQGSPSGAIKVKGYSTDN